MLVGSDVPCPCLNVQSVTRTSSVGPSFGLDLKAILSSPTSMTQRRMMTLRLLLGSMASVFGESAAAAEGTSSFVPLRPLFGGRMNYGGSLPVPPLIRN